MAKEKLGFHIKNKHKSGYLFDDLCNVYPDLKPFVFENNYQNQTIDFGNPKAVKALNTALLYKHYNITYWEITDDNLCPPIPGRVDYIHHLAELLKNCGLTENIKVLDIGTGASCIYPLLGHAEYDWHFMATDIDESSIQNANKIVKANKLESVIELRFQNDKAKIFEGVIEASDKFSASLCNPPFFKSEKEASAATLRKLKGLGKQGDELKRNFGGKPHELCYVGGEKAFVHNYLYQSSLFKTNSFWYTTLVSNKDNLKSMYASLKKLGATDIKTISMDKGNKATRIVAWTFLTKDEQIQWNDKL
jgi:23S rRNA (adenine1618-N6)-methyltransferase